MRLKEMLDKVQSEISARIPDDVKVALERSTTELKNLKIEKGAKTVGDKIPAFTLKDATGASVSSDELLKQGPLVISFYRGSWCPYCNIEMKALQDALPEITKRGATLVAISPNIPEFVKKSVDKHNVRFTVLSDTGAEVGQKFGLTFTLPQNMRPVYHGFGFNLPEENGDDTWRLPIPATYVVDTDGTIVHAHVNPDYTKREEPEAIVRALDRVRAKSAVTS